jgi:phosphoribosylamine---glycine ligase
LEEEAGGEMKLLLIDIDRAGVDIALRAQWAGHEVKHYIAPRQGKALRPNVGRGLTRQVKDWREHMKWADLILTTGSSMYSAELEDYYSNGYPIFGSNQDAAKWELDRCVGMEMFEHHGIPVPSYRKFEDYDTAIAHIKSTGESFVCKPLGMADRALSYVGKGPSDLVAQLSRMKRMNGRPKQPFILQEKMEGVEVAVAGWFGPNGWVGPWEENFEHKKLFANDLGINTGEMGTVMKYVERSALADKVLKPFTNALHALNFVGNIDVNLIIDSKGNLWPLEFTMRLGWPAFYLHTHMHKGDPINWMKDLLDGRDSLSVSYDVCVGVCIIAPTFPACVAEHPEVENIPIFGINQSNIKNIHLMEVMAGKEEVFEGGAWTERELFVSAGDWLLTVCGTGATISDARDSAYNTIGELVIPNSPAYRHDIGARLEKHLPTLKSLGYCKDWRF